MFTEKQKVWCAVYGAGVVKRIRQEGGVKYPVVVVFNRNGDENAVSYTIDGKYHDDGNVTLFPYPVEIVSRVVRPTIDWSHVHTKYRWLAKDSSGSHWLHEKQPYKTDCGWKSENGDCTCADGFATLSPGFCDWEDSLIVGPGGL